MCVVHKKRSKDTLKIRTQTYKPNRVSFNLQSAVNYPVILKECEMTALEKQYYQHVRTFYI